MNGLIQRLSERCGDLDLAERRCADEFVGRAGMPGACQHYRRRFGDIVEIDQTEPRFDRVGHAIDAVADHVIPLCETILHVGGRLQDGDIER